MAYYPRIDESTVQTLRVVRGLVENEGMEYLNKSECPYTEVVKDFLRDIARNKADGEEGDGVNLFEDVDEIGEIDLLDVQIQKMLSQMERLSRMVDQLEPNERLNFFKTRTGLMERLILLREKTTNQRDLLTFKAVVIKGLEDICSEEQVGKFMEMLNVR